MSIRQFVCETCEHPFEINIPMSECSPKEMLRVCESCGVERQFDRRLSPSTVAFGLMTRQYTGQQAAVKGWGTYATDYKNSDLAVKRSNEGWMEADAKAGREPLDAFAKGA